MGKRKRLEKKQEKIAKKIRKLNEKLRIMAEASDSESTESMASGPVEEVPTETETNNQLEEDPSQVLNEEPLEEDPLQVLNEEPLPILPEPIDEDILNALGKIEEVPKGPTAHAEIAQRWTPILLKGLTKELRSELIQKHMPFENVPIQPPKLNPEITAAVNEPARKRDAIIVNKQKQVGAALTALGKSLQLFLEKGDTIDIIKNVNDAARLMCDTIYTDTNSRRILITSVINRDMKDTLTGEADSFLFGNDLSEKIKNTKAVQKSVKELKVTYATNKTPIKPKSLNWRGPPRPNARTHTGGRPNQLGKQKKENRKPRPSSQNNRNINTHRR